MTETITIEGISYNLVSYELSNFINNNEIDIIVNVFDEDGYNNIVNSRKGTVPLLFEIKSNKFNFKGKGHIIYGLKFQGLNAYFTIVYLCNSSRLEDIFISNMGYKLPHRLLRVALSILSGDTAKNGGVRTGLTKDTFTKYREELKEFYHANSTPHLKELIFNQHIEYIRIKKDNNDYSSIKKHIRDIRGFNYENTI